MPLDLLPSCVYAGTVSDDSRAPMLDLHLCYTCHWDPFFSIGFYHWPHNPVRSSKCIISLGSLLSCTHAIGILPAETMTPTHHCHAPKSKTTTGPEGPVTCHYYTFSPSNYDRPMTQLPCNRLSFHSLPLDTWAPNIKNRSKTTEMFTKQCLTYSEYP